MVLVVDADNDDDDDVTLENSDVDVWNTEPVTIDAEAFDVLELVLVPPLAAAEKSTSSVEVNECEEEELVKPEDERAAEVLVHDRLE